jgi:hypothetical protein
MPSSWIRVNANVAREARMVRARRVLGVPKPTMVGMLVLLEIELLEQRPSGELAAFDIDTLADWAGWEGDVAPFKKALAELEEDGKLAGWDERHGVRIKQMEKDAERHRNKRRASNGSPSDVGKTSTGRPRATERNGNGTETERTGSSSNQSSNRRSGDLDQESPRARANGASPHEPGSAPPAGALRPEDLPPAAQALVARFYPREATDKRRRRDVVEQLLATLGAGARYRKATVRAHSIERLERRCAEVLREGMKDPDKAIVVLLAKLSDTSDLSAERQRRELEERADDERTEAHDVDAAHAWLVDRPDVAAAIDVQLDAEGLVAGDALQDSVRRITARSLLLAAWRADGAPELVSKP